MSEEPEETVWDKLFQEERTTLWENGNRRVYVTNIGHIGIEIGDKAISASPEMWHEMSEELDKTRGRRMNL